LVKAVKILNLVKWGPNTGLWNLNATVSYYQSGNKLKNGPKNRGAHLNN
jgi:hypothetical protein